MFPHHESHYHQDARYASSNDKLRESNHTPTPSDGKEASASSGSKTIDENFKCHIYADEVYDLSENGRNDRHHDNSKKSVPTNLTPVTIMVVDTISSVKSEESTVRFRIYNNSNQ